jgi:hypothetical protein
VSGEWSHATTRHSRVCRVPRSDWVTDRAARVPTVQVTAKLGT